MPKGALYIVSTPIGNLQDISLRAIDVLKNSDIIAAEDTRHSLKLLNYFGISKPLISYWSENEKTRSDEIITKLMSGLNVALISDAGTPGISDPGDFLIKSAISHGINVIAIPGTCAAITALSISGLNTKEFYFVGFLPSKRAHRVDKLKQLQTLRCTLIFYEAPHRILESTSDMFKVFGNRQCVICRELTKVHEEVLRANLYDMPEVLQKGDIAGEYVVLIEGCNPESVSVDIALQELQMLIKRGMNRKDAAKKIAKDYGLSKKELYDLSLQHKYE